jgi:hypothetical protein
MQRTDGDRASVRSDVRDDGHHSIVSELVSLIEHIEASMERLEAAIAREAAPDDPTVAANVVVLDDVTPRYVKAMAALNTCNAGLGVALHFLLDARTAKHGAGGFAAGARPRIRSIDRS